VPNSRITCAYSLTAVGARPIASLAAAFAAVPIDWTLPRLYGLLPISDDKGITSGNVVTRTLAFAMVPSRNALAFSTLVPGDGSGSPIEKVTLDEGGTGDGYARAPYVTFTPTSGGPDRKAVARCHMEVGSVLVLQGGSGFSGTPTVTFANGELWPGGFQATGTVNLTGDAVSSITVTSPGGPYGTFPDIVFSGSGVGTGQILVPGLAVHDVEILDQGLGYIPGTPGTTPVVVFTPYFKNEMPDSFNNQASALAEFMRTAFQYALQTPILASPPVIT
jgi:hypothetical protein